MSKVTRRYNHTQQGMSLIEIMVSIAILGIFASIATPNMKEWSSKYYLKSAATTLYSHMRMAQLGAVKDSQPWTVNFNPGTTIGYEVRNSAGTVVKKVDFHSNYSGDIQFRNPTSAVKFDVAILTFNPNGTSNTGFAYLSNQDQSSHYKVGLLLANGLVKSQKWDGTQWK